MIRNIFYSLSLLGLLFCSSCASTKNKEAKLHKEAERYALKLVQAYFTEDCQFVFDAMSDSLLIMDGDGVFAKAGREEKLCESVKYAIRDKSKNYQDYLNTYKTELLNKEQLEQGFKVQLPDYFTEGHNDFYFVGFKQKEKASTKPHFIWDDMFVFMLRKKGKTWMLKGLSG